ncbi:hypothetical protein BH11VER1_BH11VER1_28090 [soil metagenome]
MNLPSLASFTLLFSVALPLCAQDKAEPKKPTSKPKVEVKSPEVREAETLAAARAKSPYGEWTEADFPFFSSVLDARGLGEGWPKDNLTPRGLILNLGHDMWACFDTDLLRIALIWQGEPGKSPATQVALAPGSYHLAGQKTKDGQDFLPKPVGTPWLANGIYPGWQVGGKPSFTDPREAAPSKEEVGRGALNAKLGEFQSVQLVDGAPELHYKVSGVAIRERIETLMSGDKITLTRHFDIAAHDKKLALVEGFNKPGGANQAATPKFSTFDTQGSTMKASVKYSFPKLKDAAVVMETKARRWPQSVTTKATLSEAKDAYVLDDIPLPNPNPWKRNVRLADITFLDDQGHAAAVSFDGDVWLISGLKGDLQDVQWKRFASGLHEPMSLCVRKETQDLKTKDKRPEAGADSSLLSSIYIYDRNGIWKLKDTNGDGEADVYEMFCNLFAQTAETREFPNSMKLAPDGSFVISKGGQEGTTLGKDNGKVLRVAADGKSYETLGWGLRQPFIGVHPKTGLVTASDQQGNYVPSTPLHIIKDNQYYGFLSELLPVEKYPAPIADPLTWIPHPVNSSGVTQTWLVDAKMGTLNDELIHIGYNRPEIFRVLQNNRLAKPQAAVVPFVSRFDFPLLNGIVNPADGQLYLIGFQVWGTTAKRISGLARLRYTGEKRVLLKECIAMDKGMLLRFNEALDAKIAADVASYSVERWNYQRTSKYGSPHLKLDGSSGQEWMMPSSAYVSTDGKSVFIGIPDMKPVMQMRVGWGVKSAEGLGAQNNAYFTPYELEKFVPTKEGFGEIQVDLTPRKAETVAAVKPTLEEGQRLYQMIGCMACHSIDGSVIGKVGPTWKGLYGSNLEFKDDSKGVADEAYLRESITSPTAKIVKGYEKYDAGMPIYAGILNDSQIESLVLYIKTLK